MMQEHHIVYKPGWTVSLTGYQHLVITRIQGLKPTAANYAQVTGFLHALTHEWQRLRYQLDKADQENINP